VIADTEFSTRKMRHLKTNTRKIVRFMDLAAMADPGAMARFQKLYKKELTYFRELSEISQTQEGYFYAREHFEGMTMRAFIRKMGLDQKTRIDQLRSNDLKTIFLTFREIQGLSVSHCNLNEDTIYVVSDRGWSLQRDMEIRLTGFTSEDCEADAMKQQLHQMFRRLLDAKLYTEICQKFVI
jgi:hypothetical protein